MATEPPIDDVNTPGSPPPGGDPDIAAISIVDEMKRGVSPFEFDAT